MDVARGMMRTARLTLRQPMDEDLDDLFRLHADPAVWSHFPSGRHLDVRTTRRMLERVQQGWRDHGQDVWVAHETASGRFVGVGGPDLRRGVAWNLYYRLVPAAQGLGCASEIAAASLERARDIAPGRPVIAFLVEHNVASRRTAERAGLRLRWRGPDAGNPDPDAVRLVYADRQLTLAAFLHTP